MQAPVELDPVQLAAEVAEEVLRLPAVATIDWCDRAAACVARIGHPSIASVAVVSVDERGFILDREASGAAISAGEAARGQEDRRIVGLRVRIEELSETGWLPGELERADGACLLLSESGAWKDHPLGRFWTGLDAGAPVAAMVALGEPSAGRVLLIQVAPLSGRAAGKVEASVLRAVLPILHRRGTQALGARRKGPGHWLTVREQIVLEQLVLGKSVKEIAEMLGRSPHTVHDHVKALHRKLEASTRGELVARALGHPGSDADADPPVATGVAAHTPNSTDN